MTRPSLLDLANKAVAAQKTGESHAALVVEGEQMDAAQLAAIEKAALAGDDQYREAIQYLKEAREATFNDAFARAAYFRNRIENMLREMNEGKSPEPEAVLAVFFSAMGTKMFVRTATNGKEPRPAIPLFRSHDRRDDARKHHPRPIQMPASFRKEQGGLQEHMSGSDFRFVVPTTTADRECFEQMRLILARMPEALVEWLKGQPKMDVRQVVWLALHLVHGTRVVGPSFARRLFEEEDGELRHTHTGELFLKFKLSDHEIMVMRKNETNEHLVALLKDAAA